MPRPTTASALESFLGVSDQSPSKIGENQAAILKNLYIFNDARELVRRKGTSQLTGAHEDANAFDGLFFTRIDGTDYLLGCHNGDVEDWLNVGAIVSGGTGAQRSGTPASAALIPSTFNQALYLGNGTDQNVRFDGTAVAAVMCSQPGSGTTGGVSGGGTLFGSYTYRVTFLSADGLDSQASAASAAIVAAGAAQFDLTAIPVAPAGEGCTGRRLWRRNESTADTTWYLVGTISDNTTATFTDSTADADIDTSVAVDMNAVRFPPCEILVSHQLRLCGILCDTSEGDRKTLYVSDQQKPWYCPEVVLLDEVDDPTQGARIALPEEPVGLVTRGSELIIFFPRQAWRLIGDNPNNWEFVAWQPIGCASHRTLRNYKYSLVWLAADGVYEVAPAIAGFAGSSTTMRRISEDIRSHLDALTADDFSKAHAFVWYDRYYLCFPTSAFVYDFRFNAWSELTAWEWDHSTVSENSGTSKELVYATAHGTGQVWELETGTDDNGAAISVQWRSKAKDMGQFGRQKRLHRVICHFAAASGTATVNLYRAGGELIQTFTQDVATPLAPGGSLSELDDRCVEGARSEYFALEVLHAALSSDFRILDMGSMYTVVT